MLIIPAIDLRGGRCVRLLQGDADRERPYDDDPTAAARRWVEQGARWLHVVDLDGAFAGRPVQLSLVTDIAAACGVPVQAGGGFRRLEDIEAGLAAGLARVIISTEARTLAADAADRFGDGVIVSLDVREGRAAVAGWRRELAGDPVAFARELEQEGVRRFVYTGIAQDGMLGGPDLEGLRALIRAVHVPVIAAGGISGPQDVRAVEAAGAEGAIIGRALYEGAIDLRALIAAEASC